MSPALTIPGIGLMDRNQPSLSEISLYRIQVLSVNTCTIKSSDVWTSEYEANWEEDEDQDVGPDWTKLKRERPHPPNPKNINNRSDKLVYNSKNPDSKYMNSWSLDIYYNLTWTLRSVCIQKHGAWWKMERTIRLYLPPHSLIHFQTKSFLCSPALLHPSENYWFSSRLKL